MPPRHVVVDGSNLATEGRSLPSLQQLDEAVRAYKAEWPDDDVLVVVDASFSYRIDESERQMFEGAENAGEVVSPPAGAIGRGDGFLLRIADRTDAVVLSNDSFQEFHGEYPWLFEEGRLIGGKPVPGVGWIFTPRSPVRGPKSRVAVRDARTKRRPVQAEPVAQAIAEATAEAVSVPEPRAARRSGRRRSRTGAPGAPTASPAPEAVNDPLPFITFIAEHHLGTEVDGTVDSFTSHGAFVVADGARCYAPVVGLGDPPPRSAKDVLKRGETRTFVVQALDPPRRGIELALPGLAKVAGAPTEETVEAEIDVAAQPSRRRRPAKAVPAATDGAAEPTEPAAEPAEPVTATAEHEPPVEAAPAKRGRRAPARKAALPAEALPGAPVPATRPSARKAAAKKAPAAEPVAATEPATTEVATEPAAAAPARKRATRKATATEEVAKVPAKKAAVKRAVKKAPTPDEAPATKAPARKAAVKKAPVKKAAVKKAAVKKAAVKKAPTPDEAPATKAPVKGSATKKAPAQKAPAKRAAAKKAAAAPTG